MLSRVIKQTYVPWVPCLPKTNEFPGIHGATPNQRDLRYLSSQPTPLETLATRLTS